MAVPHVLLFGGNGNVARLMTRTMLEKSWKVTSVIRRAQQEHQIREFVKGSDSNLDFVVCDLTSIKSAQDAGKILDSVKPDSIIFTASDMSNAWSIDRDCARYVIKASVERPSISKFLIISFPSARRKKAPWWDLRDVKTWRDETRSYPDIAEAKLQADEYLLAMAHKRQASGSKFQGISLRPSWFTSGTATGKIQLGKTRHLGRVTRGDVANTAVLLLARDDTSGWLDLLEGNQDIEDAIDSVVENHIDASEGEDLEKMYQLADE